jgi:hypothetical protein
VSGQRAALVNPVSVIEALEDFRSSPPSGVLVASSADRPPERGGGTAFYSSHGTDVTFLVASSSPRLQRHSQLDSTEAESPALDATSTTQATR